MSDLVERATAAFKEAYGDDAECDRADDWMAFCVAAALRVALEEAARVAEKNAEQCGPVYANGFPAIECRVVEQRIRDLIPKEGEEP